MSEQASTLQSLRAAWQARWSAMAPRERRLATAAAWLAGLTLVLMVGIRPAWKTLNQTPVQLREVEQQLDTMRRLADETQVLRQRPPVPPAQAEAALKSATDRLGASARLSVQGDRATVTFNGVQGDALATWLDEVRVGARVKPLEARLQQTEMGRYAGTLVLALTAAQAR